MSMVDRRPAPEYRILCMYARARYTPLRDLLASLLPKWEVSILTFSLGIRGSYIPHRWTVQLNRLGLVGARVEKLMEGMVSQALTELTAIYSTRYAAIQHKQHMMSD